MKNPPGHDPGGFFMGCAVKVGGLWIYPVKSLGGVAVPSADLEPRGFAGDRRWMIVDAAGRFVTRREVPSLARIAMSLVAEGGYRLSAPEGEALLAAEAEGGVLTPVIVWRDTVEALVVENDSSRLISAVAGRPLRLAFMPEASRRAVDSAYAMPGEHVSFADGFPLLVTTQASLAALNTALDRPVPMERFRPNIVIAGDEMEPWAEDSWPRITIGNVGLRFTKPCSRCIVITQNPHSGDREEGNAVPMTLRRLGRVGREGVLFGMNAVPEVLGRIMVGDAVRAVLPSC